MRQKTIVTVTLWMLSIAYEQLRVIRTWHYRSRFASSRSVVLLRDDRLAVQRR